MSYWQEVKEENIDYDEKQEEVEIQVGRDNMGNNYITIPLPLLKKVIKKYKIKI